MKASTILQHLADYHREGHPVDAERLLPYVQANEAGRGTGACLRSRNWAPRLSARCSTRSRARCLSMICGCCGYTTCRLNHPKGRQNRDTNRPARRALGPGRHGARFARRPLGRVAHFRGPARPADDVRLLQRHLRLSQRDHPPAPLRPELADEQIAQFGPREGSGCTARCCSTPGCSRCRACASG